MLTLNVDGMTCQHCVAAVTRAVQSVSPDAQVDVNLDTKRVSIDGTDDLHGVTRAINDAGFDATPA